MRIRTLQCMALLHSSALSPGWALTSYNNQGDPPTFYSVGAEESALAGTAIAVK